MELGLHNQLSTLTGGQQTMLSWAKVIESYDSIPDAYKNSYKTALGNTSPFPHTVLAPAIPGLRHKATEKLLCEMNNTIYIWERVGNKVDVTAYPVSTISDLEIGNILLYSWLTISGTTESGMATSTTVEFNAATERHFVRFVNKMRPSPVNMEEAEQHLEQAKFDHLATENFKFMNYGRKSLVRGEKVLQMLWQSKICKPHIMVMGYTLYQTSLSLAHLTILTDKELIVIHDDERSAENRGARHGGKWQYIALDHIHSVSLREQANDLLTLSLMLSPGTRHLEIVFASSKREEIAQLRDRLEKLKG